MEQHYKNYYVNEVISDVKQLLYENKTFEETNPELIPFADKIYNLKDNRLLEYSSDFFFTNKIPIKIDTENKECPFIDRLFESFVGSENKNILYELSAYCLYRGYPFQKFFVLIGDGRNGKSTFIKIIYKLIGKENISSVNFKDITSDRFSTSQLYKKLVNFSGELDNYTIKHTSILKQLTGEDYITVQEKFKNPFQFENYAKIIVVTNVLPESVDASEAYFRRLMIIDFPNRFIAGDNAVADIANKITKEELEGFAYQCLQKLKELKTKDFVFENNTDIEDAFRHHISEETFLINFINESTDKNLEALILSDDFAIKFKEYQKNIGSIPWSPNKITKYMNRLGFQKSIKPLKNIEGNWTTKSAWLGLKWKEQ